MSRIEIALSHRPVDPSQFDRNVVKPAGCKAAIEMPQARNEHANDGDLNVGPRLVEHEEIVARPGSDLDAGIDLIAVLS